MRPLLPSWLRRWTEPKHPVPPWVSPALSRRFRRWRHDAGDSAGGFSLPSRRDHYASIQSDIDVATWHYCCNGASVSRSRTRTCTGPSWSCP